MIQIRRLTQRQTVFVRAYVRDGGRNASLAARKAGFSPGQAHVRAHRLLRRDYVLAAIAHEPGGEPVMHRLARRTRSENIREQLREALDHSKRCRTAEVDGRICVYKGEVKR